jgi:serine/threonine-protein kinase RsbW
MNTHEIIADRQLEFSSTLENIALVEKLIDDVCNEFSISEDLYGNIIISITEAVNNAIKHGNQNNISIPTQVKCQILTDKITFVITDQGPGFNYAGLPDPTAPENLEIISGRGIFLMQQLAEEVKFNEQGNQVELSFSFTVN